MNRAVVRRLIYPAYRKLKRDRVLDFLAEMRTLERASPDEIRESQWRKTIAILDHAAKNVPYYRRVFKQIGATAQDFREPADLSSLPLLRKQDIRDNLDFLIAEGRDRKYLRPDETGGSTGQNLFFYTDRRAISPRLANVVRMNHWLGIRIGDRKASLWGMRFRMSRAERVRSAIRNWLDNTVYVPAYKMDAETVARQIQRLASFKPDLLTGFPSVLYHFARTMPKAQQGRLMPKVVLSSGETLYEWQREAIENGFGARIYNHYGCCEFGAIARECTSRDGLHVAVESVFIETLPVARSAAGEETQELVITGLDNYCMPLIRYAIEDLGTVTWEQCECGLTLPRLKSLAGRVYDVVRAPNGNFLGGTFWGHILKEGVDRFQVVQDKLDEVTITVVPTDQFGDQTRRYVLDKVRAACGSAMKVRFEMRKDIEMSPAGKHRYVISKIGASAAGGDQAARPPASGV